MEKGNKIIVFDFDKTLTYKDTLMGYYIYCNRNVSIIYKLPIFYCFVALKIFKIISIQKLKEVGIALFLKGKSKSDLEIQGKEYAKKIKFNKAFYDIFLPIEKEVIIISASFNEYLRFVFSNSKVYGTTIIYKNEIAQKMGCHLYGKSKVKLLALKNIVKIDILYTDSFSDKPLMDIAEKIFLVKGDIINELI